MLIPTILFAIAIVIFLLIETYRRGYRDGYEIANMKHELKECGKRIIDVLDRLQKNVEILEKYLDGQNKAK